MNDIIKLYAAFRDSTLCRVTFGQTFISVDYRTDEEMRALAAEVGAVPSETIHGDMQWDGFETTLGGVAVYVTGPHRKVQKERAA